MALLLLLAVSYAASLIWLTVRIINRKERWAKRTLAVVVLLPGLYVTSFGPACWWLSGPIEEGPVFDYVEARCAPRIYQPLAWLARHGPRSVRVAVNWWATIGTRDTIWVDSFGDRDSLEGKGTMDSLEGGIVLWREVDD
jgi:hypothetical protein